LCVDVANKKFLNVFVRFSQNHISWGLTFVNLAADWRIVMRIFLLALAFQIVSV